MKSSISPMSSVPGILSWPIPSTLYGTPSGFPSPFVRHISARIDPTGSPAMISIFGFFSLRYLPTPVIVPPVPAAYTKCVTRPSV
jgi:hypothetical protein